MNLILEGKPGEPQASRCGVYGLRYDGMPIKLVNTKGQIVGESKCALNSSKEVETIVPHIGRGCSLEVIR